MITPADQKRKRVQPNRINAGNNLNHGRRARYFSPKYIAPGTRFGRLTLFVFTEKIFAADFFTD
jgi:hypothetical protein